MNNLLYIYVSRYVYIRDLNPHILGLHIVSASFEVWLKIPFMNARLLVMPHDKQLVASIT